MAPIAGLPDVAVAQSGGLELSIAAQRAWLGVRLTNRSEKMLRVYFAADGPYARHHDFLTVSLTGRQSTRRLRFTGDRNLSRLGLVELGAGGNVADDIDLMAWAADPINGHQAISGGDYALTATYRVDQAEVWSGAITAGPIRLVIS